jgi:outer membrane protein W
MSRITVVLLCAGIFAAPPTTLRAQAPTDTTTAAFHEGEWAVGFVQGKSLSEAGVLRFATPTRAWVLDGWATLDKTVEQSVGPFGTDINGQTDIITAQLGPRWYHATSSHLARFLGIGISGSYAHAQFPAASNRENLWSAGVYGEIGVQYMFTRHLGLGWRANLLATRTADRVMFADGSPDQQTTMYHLVLEPVQITGTVYF